MRHFVSILIVCTLSLNCMDSPPRLPVAVKVSSVANETQELSELGRYERAVLLETREDALIGGIQSIKLDPRTGDILIGDFRANKKIYRFTPEGKYLRSYGSVGQGPGEYQSIHGFAPLDNGNIVVLGSFKILLFQSDGSLVLERPLRMALPWVEAVGNHIVVRAVRGPEAGDF